MDSCDPAGAARRILAAMEAGNLAWLEAELDRPLCMPADLPSENAERWELLDAIAGAMRLTLCRMRRNTIAHFEGIEVNLRLLRHLAGETPAVLT
jgi:hypothetical protein